MAYTASSFTALEQPSLTKWNYLWDNDAFFNSQIGANFGSGTTSKVWMEELGRTTLGSAGDTIAISSIAARKYLRIIVSLIPSGAIVGSMRFNSDTGNNYSYSSTTAGAAAATVTSTSSIRADVDTTATLKWVVYDVINISAQPKLVTAQITSESASGAGTAPAQRELVGKWQNTAAQITAVTIFNDGGAGDFATGSEVIVLGHD